MWVTAVFSFLVSMCMASTGECLPMTKTGGDFPTYKECIDQAAENARNTMPGKEVFHMVGPCVPSEQAQHIEDIHIPKTKR